MDADSRSRREQHGGIRLGLGSRPGVRRGGRGGDLRWAGRRGRGRGSTYNIQHIISFLQPRGSRSRRPVSAVRRRRFGYALGWFVGGTQAGLPKQATLRSARRRVSTLQLISVSKSLSPLLSATTTVPFSLAMRLCSSFPR